ncbi:MAG TPA: hypothetical protein VH251_00630 [Verrucomicrobiae bacterium]|nr:hypothetical protein [Verrucomicrobiae bacterium]
MTTATINRFIKLFADAFESLGAKVSMHEIESLAMMVHNAMEGKGRAYHTSSHVFQMCRGMDARQVLAALFHDVVYYQIDGGFPKLAVPLLETMVRHENGVLTLKAIEAQDTGLQLCADLFEFKPGQALPPSGGMNEFLSAALAVRLLQPHLPMRDLIVIAACITATVPFRGPDAEGRSFAEALAGRVRKQSQKLLAKADAAKVERQVTHAMHEAIKIGNRDVCGFAESNPAKFLTGTWQLIEESNVSLAVVKVYTLQDYRGALVRMQTFLAGLNPENIFRQYEHYPTDTELARLNTATKKNLAFAADYLGAKINTIAILEALALETGGNCPVSMFLGDIRGSHGKAERAKDFLPPAKKAAGDIKPQLLHVLEKGRAQESSMDLNASPLTAAIYWRMGQAGMQQTLAQAKRMFAGELSAHEFLKGLDRDLIRMITDVCAKIAISRSGRLTELQTKLAKKR